MTLSRFLIVFIVAILTAPVGVAQKKKKELGTSDLQISQDQEIFAEATFIEAQKQVILENYSKAYELFLKGSELTPDNAAIHFKMAEVLVKNGENQKALQNITKAVELDPDNKYYYLFQVEIHKALSDFKAAAKTYEALLKNVPNTESYWLDLGLLYKYLAQWDKALSAFEQAEAKLGMSLTLLREKQQIYLRQNKMDQLIADWKKFTNTRPDQPEYVLELITILLANDLLEDAALFIETFNTRYPENNNIYLIQSEVERKKGDYRKALAQLIIPAGSSDIELTTKIQAINAYLPFIQTEGMRLDLFKIVDNMVTAHPTSFEAWGFAGDIYLNLDSANQALNYYRESVKFGQTNFGVWQNIANLEYEGGHYDSLIFHCQQALEFFPNQPIFYFYEGLSHLIQEDYRKSVRALEQGLGFASDKQFQALFLGQLGDAYYHRKEFEEAYKNYEKCLEIQPDNYGVLNNYSYYLSLRGDRLERALEMSGKVVADNPQNATFLDTHGWVLFVKGDYVEAYKYLERAAGLEEDGTIIEHLGDVLFKLGDIEKAVETWKKAKGAGETTDQIDKKIQDRQYYE
ncbi:MAG: tetratricopeptide repeat protein [Cyclobacteriaceae bacterium]